MYQLKKTMKSTKPLDLIAEFKIWKMRQEEHRNDGQIWSSDSRDHTKLHTHRMGSSANSFHRINHGSAKFRPSCVLTMWSLSVPKVYKYFKYMCIYIYICVYLSNIYIYIHSIAMYNS